MNRSKINITRLLAVLLVLWVGLAGANYATAGDKIPVSEFAFRSEMRKLWEDHITWTRLYIVSVAAGLPDQQPTAQRLLQNQTDIGDAIKPFYGEQAGEQLSNLLSEHIMIAAELLDAAKSGDAVAFQDAHTSWYANADEIAAFLNAANPDHWPLDMMETMMRDHLDLTLEEASSRLSGDWEADIAAYDKIHTQILEMADMLSDGIVHQFPKAFK